MKDQQKMTHDFDGLRQTLLRWSQSLSTELSVDGLLARCSVAHKWKAPYRSIVIREALFWRMHDLGQQALLLMDHNHILGARILLRSAIETLALLIYLNQKTSAVLSGTLSFFAFEEITRQLLMGSKNDATSMPAVNVLTVLKQAEKSHSGIVSMHEHLSESAHPNFDGVLLGYSSTDPDKRETTFVNNWGRFFGPEQEPGTSFILEIFEHEYNDVWLKLMSDLEGWLRDNNADLEAQRAALEAAACQQAP